MNPTATAGTILRYFAITFAATWTFWFAAAAASSSSGGAAHPVVATLLLYLGTFTPGLLAVAMTARADGMSGVRALLGKLFKGNVGGRWYLFAIGFMATIKLSAAGVHRVAIGVWPQFGEEAWYLMLAATVFSVLVGGQTGEEVGWRGFALPRLAERMGLARASILLGVIWASWHLPLFFIFPGADTNGQSFPLYLLQVTALSVAIAWLWWRTNGSLLLPMLLHAAANNTKDIVPSAQPGATNVFALSTSPVAWITVALLWIAAVGFLMQMPRARPVSGISRPANPETPPS